MVARTLAICRHSGQAVVKRAGWTWLRLYALMGLLSLLAALAWKALDFPVIPPQMFPIAFYQHIIDPLDGHSCPSYPPCSAYARQAVTRHGLLVGSWLALDRLIHEGGDLERARLVRAHGRLLSYDPLDRNDFWLKETNR